MTADILVSARTFRFVFCTEGPSAEALRTYKQDVTNYIWVTQNPGLACGHQPPVPWFAQILPMNRDETMKLFPTPSPRQCMQEVLRFNLIEEHNVSDVIQQFDHKVSGIYFSPEPGTKYIVKIKILPERDEPEDVEITGLFLTAAASTFR